MTIGEGEPDKEAAVLLDQVMRGERPLIFPPGTFMASLFIPCFAVGASGLAMAGGLMASRSVNAIIWSLAAGILLSAVAMTGHILVIRGYSRHRVWMRTYVRSLFGCALLGFVAAAVAKVSVPWFLVPVGLIAFAACSTMLSSRSYLAFASFMSLKRKYREDHVAASEHVLGHRDRSPQSDRPR